MLGFIEKQDKSRTHVVFKQSGHISKVTRRDVSSVNYMNIEKSYLAKHDVSKMTDSFSVFIFILKYIINTSFYVQL